MSEINKKEKLSTEEVIKHISNDKMTPLNKLGRSYVAIRKLVDFTQVLEKNEKDYKDEMNIKICEDTDLHPSDILSHYIILEAFNFYDTLKYLKKSNTSLPNIPSYFDKLAKVRNKVVAHKDTGDEFPLARDVLRVLKELSDEASIRKIVGDINQTFISVSKTLNN